MKIDWNFIELLITITFGTMTVSQYLYKIVKFMGAKSRSMENRMTALYEALKIQNSQFEELINHVNKDPQSRGKFRRNSGLQDLKEQAIKDFENENTNFT